MFDYALIDICKNPSTPKIIVQSIMKRESSKNPLAINVNHNGKSLVSYKPKTKEEAHKLASEWVKKGYSVDVGLMQFNTDNLKTYSAYTIKDLLDPCTNIKLGSSIYQDNFDRTNKNQPYKDRVLKSLSAYNTGSFERGFLNGYVLGYKPLLSAYLKTSYFGKSSKALRVARAKRTSKKTVDYAKFLLRAKAPSNLVYN